MSVAEKIIRAAELQQLLETPLDPNLDYFDATGSITAIAEHLQGMHKLVNFLANTLVMQGQSVIELRQKCIELEGDMAAAGIGSKDGQRTELVGFDKPSLIKPN